MYEYLERTLRTPVSNSQLAYYESSKMVHDAGGKTGGDLMLNLSLIGGKAVLASMVAHPIGWLVLGGIATTALVAYMNKD